MFKGLLYVPLECQPKRNAIFLHCIGHLNYLSVLTKKVVLPDFLSAPRNFFHNHLHQFYEQSRPVFKVTANFSALGDSGIRCVCSKNLLRVHTM